jgi:hypothetical protein
MVQATSTCCLVVGLTSVVLMLGICAAGADPTTTFVRVVAGAYIYGWLGFIGTSLGGAVVHGISGGIHGLKETIKEKAKKNTHDEQYGLPFAEARLKPAVRIEQDVSVAANAA